MSQNAVRSLFLALLGPVGPCSTSGAHIMVFRAVKNTFFGSKIPFFSKWNPHSGPCFLTPQKYSNTMRNTEQYKMVINTV